jgi:hypothetical protein
MTLLRRRLYWLLSSLAALLVGGTPVAESQFG